MSKDSPNGHLASVLQARTNASHWYRAGTGPLCWGHCPCGTELSDSTQRPWPALPGLLSTLGMGVVIQLLLSEIMEIIIFSTQNHFIILL